MLEAAEVDEEEVSLPPDFSTAMGSEGEPRVRTRARPKPEAWAQAGGRGCGARDLKRRGWLPEMAWRWRHGRRWRGGGTRIGDVWS